jgi:hypothetical protein
MAKRNAKLVIKNSDIVNRPYSGATLLAGEAIVNTADGIMLFSGVTTSTAEWTPSGPGGNSSFFEVGSNLYDLKIRNKITKYEGIEGAGLVGKFLSGTTNGFTLADISSIQGVDSYVTGGTYNQSTDTITLTLNEGKPNVDITGVTDYFTTGATLIGSIAYFNRNDSLSAYTLDLSTFISTGDTYVTGYTYDNANTFTISRNQGLPDLTATINTVTGMTNTGNLDLQGELSNSTGNVVINDNLDITGNTTSWGNILPGTHLGYDLGANGQRWDELWVRKVRLGTTTTTLEDDGSNFTVSGSNGNFIFIPVSSGNTVIHSDVLPDADLTRDIGAPSLRWNIHAGDLNATGLTISSLGSNRVIYTDGSGALTTEAGFEYNPTLDTMTVGNIDVTNDLTVNGDLTVLGTSISAFTSELYIEDNNITLNYNPTGNTSITSVNAGWTIQDGDGLSGDVKYNIVRMQNLTGATAETIPDLTEYTAGTGYANRGWATELNDIIIRSTDPVDDGTAGSVTGVRVLAEFDVLDGGNY